jgi:hypothetical protein
MGMLPGSKVQTRPASAANSVTGTTVLTQIFAGGHDERSLTVLGNQPLDRQAASALLSSIGISPRCSISVIWVSYSFIAWL